MNDDLHDRVALVTGGARRIGAAIARSLHAQGMRLAVHYRTSERDAHLLMGELNEARPDSAVLICSDLSDVAKVRRTALDAVSAFGRLDLLVNNASRYPGPAFGAAEETAWDACMAVNLKAPFFLCQAAAPALREQRGSIVNIGDVYAGRPLSRAAVYSAAKAALVSLTRSLAAELAPEVRVNAVSPGAILWPDGDTDEIGHQRLLSRIPMRRAGDPEDIARAVVYLARDAGYVTGQVLTVDGGRSAIF